MFVYGFPKSERSNIGPDELRAFRKLAADLLAGDIAKAVKIGELVEIKREPGNG